MESSKDQSSSIIQKENLLLTEEAISYLLKAAKWGKFLAILGFIVTGLIFIGGVLMTFIIGMLPDDMIPLNMPFSPTIISIIYVVIAAISAVPVFFLNSFCNNAIKAVNLSDSGHMTHAIRNLKRLFVFIGISTIVFLALYTLILIVVGSAAFMSI